MHIKTDKNNNLFTHRSDFPLLNVDCRLSSSCQAKRNLIVNEAKNLVGSKYTYSSLGPTSFDSASLIHYVYKDSINKMIPISLIELLRNGETISSVDDLLPGDLVFVSNGSHVGIYIGENEMIHSPFNRQRVKSSPITNFYCGKRYLRVNM